MKAKKRLNLSIPLWWPSGPSWRRLARWLLPTPGNVLFTLLVMGGLLWATSAGALPFRAPALAGDSTTTISYQGRLADSSGNPVTTSGVGMQFRLYNTDTGGSPLWEESHTAVPAEDGLFHVLLGSTNPIPVSLLASNSTLWLGITVGSDSEMTPREQIASVPYAMIASTVADGSVTTSKIADGSVTDSKLASPITAQSWWAYCLTPHEPLCGSSVVSDYSNTSVGNNQLLRWTLPLNPFPHALVGYWGELQFADDAVVKGSVTIAVVPDGNVLRCSAMVPSGYFNTVNSRVYLTAYGY